MAEQVSMPGTPPADSRERALRGLGVAALNGIAGPPIGASVFILLVVVHSLTTDPAEALKSIGTFTVFSYIFGVVPAVISGLLLGFHTYRHGTYTYRRAIVVALIGVVIWGLVLAVQVPPAQTAQAPGFASQGAGVIVFLAPFAVLAAVVCRWLAARFGLVDVTRK